MPGQSIYQQIKFFSADCLNKTFMSQPLSLHTTKSKRIYMQGNNLCSSEGSEPVDN